MKKQNDLLQRALIALGFCGVFVLSGAKVNAQAPKVDIHTAVITGDMAALRQHIAAGANLNQKDPMGGSSPLISACVFGRTDMAKMLIAAGADINFQNNDGSTPLLTAAFFCRPEIVKLLLEKGANKGIRNKYGQNACDAVSAPFANMKPVYSGIEKLLAPMGLSFDYAYIEKMRPVIAGMLK